MSVMQELIERMERFWKRKPWKNLKKTDYFVWICIGILLMVITLPTQPSGENQTGSISAKENTTEETEKTAKVVQRDDYTEQIEHRLEQVLSQMEGVGRVEVMITVSDFGTQVLEKDLKREGTTTTETDSSGGSRTVADEKQEETTIYSENGQEKLPYVQREQLPTVEGVLVVAEGGGNSRTISQISETIQALFSVEAHKIKVVKMSSKEG